MINLLKNRVKKIWLSLTGSNRIVLLDYGITPKRLYTEEPPSPHHSLYELISKERPAYKNLLTRVLTYSQSILSIPDDKNVKNDKDPGWNNSYFPGLDMIMLYTLLAEIKPRQYIEIGSGTSTRIAYKARKDHALTFSITSIDPAPRKEIIDIADKIETTELQAIPLEYFRSLNEGDILFFDGTHTLYPNSDVLWFFLEVLPVLKKGVYVHLHDIYLPYDYPVFMCERYYNEQYILASCLLNNPAGYTIICPNYFIYTEKELHNLLSPLWDHPVLAGVEKHGGSFWMKMG